MWLLLVPIAVVVLAVMFVAGAAMAVFAVAHAAPWLLILAGVWLVVAASRGSRRRGRWRTAPVGPAPRPGPFFGQPRPMAGGARPPAPSPTAPRPVAPAPYRAAPGPAAPAADRPAAPTPPASPPRELPLDLQVKVEQIRHKADLLLGYAGRFPPFSHDLHIVRQTAADYLPRTVAAYLTLPAADDPIVAVTGKPAEQELREQLDLLDAKLDDIARDLHRQDADRLLANRRFLEERFRVVDPEVEPAVDQSQGAA